MEFSLSGEQAAFVGELSRYLDGIDTAAAVAEWEDDEMDTGPAARAVLQQMGKDGWLGIGWPKEYGGGGRSAIEQWLFQEELAYRRLPHGGQLMSLASVGPTLMRLGTAQQKRQYLPGILAGEIEFALGYTEPNAGSDLAGLETRAVRQGDVFVANGQKLYTTAAHIATHLWLAARTDPHIERHAGITIFIVPMDAPGISVRPLHTQSDCRTNEVFLDDVEIPAADLVGAENEGWRVITLALDLERMFPYSNIAREYLDVVSAMGSLVSDDGSRPIEEASVRESLADLGAAVEIARLLALRSAWLIEHGRVPHAEASMVKVWTSELRQRIAATALDLIGEAGQLKVRTPGAPGGGKFERVYRHAPLRKFGAGTNEVQRNIIAQRGLGLPRK